MDELQQHPIDELAEEFLARYRRGERPSLEEFIAEHPKHEAEIRDLFPALLAMEKLAPSVSETARSLVLRQPERLGDYRIIREIGRGGMGVVYEAEQESLGRHVALKLLPPYEADNVTVLKRFTREARAAGQLHHTNIVPVFDVGECDGLHYYSMPLIKGQSLAEIVGQLRVLRVKEGPAGLSNSGVASEVAATLVSGDVKMSEPDAKEEATPRDANEADAVCGSTLSSHSDLSGSRHGEARYWRNIARIGIQLADAIQFAHDQGIVHRDIKPSNILLDVFGTPWLTDFGLAQTAEKDLTRPDTFVGTLRYMAPEQLRGWADPRTDVYGFGLTLYELLALRPALVSEDRAEMLKQICDREPTTPRQLDRSIPQDLETIVLKAIDKEPSRRYQSAAALSEDLTRFLELKPILAKRTSAVGHLWRWCYRNPYIATLAGTVALLLTLMSLGASTAAIRLARQAKDLRQQSQELAADKQDALTQLFHAKINEARAARNRPGIGRRLDTLEAVRRAAALRPEVPHSNDDVLELRNLATAALTFADVKVEATIDTGSALQVDLDSELSLVASGDLNGQVTVRRVDGDIQIAQLEGFGKPAAIFFFSPDACYLAVGYAGQGERSCVIRVWDWRQAKIVVESAGYPYGIGFSPDSKSIAIPQLKRTVEIYDLVTGERRLVLQTEGDPPYPQFRPTHRSVAVASKGSSKVQCFDIDTGEPRDGFHLPMAAEGIRWSPNGRYLAYGTGGSEVAVWDAEVGRDAGTLIGHRSSAWPQEFAPSSDFLLTRSWDGRAVVWELSSHRPLFEVPGAAIRISHDGHRFAVHETGKRTVIYQMFLSDVFQHVKCASHLQSVATSPRGGLVAAAGDKGVWFLDPRLKSVLRHDAVGESRSVAFHPQDGSLLATSPRGVLRWEVQRTDDSPPQISEPKLIARAEVVRGYQRLALSGAGDELAYFAQDRQVQVIPWQDSGEPKSFDIDETLPGLENIAISPDGRWVAAVSSGYSHVYVWESDTATLVYRGDQSGGYGSVLFSPDSKQLVLRYWTEYVVLQTGDWGELLRIPREPTTCWGMAFSPDGSLVALSHSNQLVQLCDARTFEPLVTLQAPVPLDHTALCFTADSQRLYVTSQSGTLSCWDVAAIHQQLEALGVAW